MISFTKMLIFFSVTFLLIGPLTAQSGWEILKAPQEPLINAIDNVFFWDQNNGWIAGRSGSNTPTVILHTTDAGITWEMQSYIPAGTDTSWKDVCFVDPDNGWVVGSGGVIWHTANGGSTWTDQTPGFTTITLNAVSAVDADVAFACGDNGTILKTTDGGDNWTDQSAAAVISSDLDDIHAFDSNRAFVMSGSNDGVIGYTSDGGAIWNATNVPFPPVGASQKQYSCTGLPDGTSYTSGYYGTIFKSTDFGQTWINVANIFGSRLKIFYSVAASGNNIWAGNSSGKIYRSSDGGAVWDTLDFPSANNIKYIRDFDGTNIYVFADYAQFFKSSDGGQSFLPILTWPNIYLYAIENASSNKIFMGGKDGGEISESGNAGISWSYPIKASSRTIGGITDISFLNENVGLFCGESGQIGKTNNGGQSWSLKPNSYFALGSTKTYQFIFFRDSLNGLVGGSSGIIQHTSDGGETWTEGGVGTTSTLYDCTFPDVNTGIIAASSGKVYRSNDGGMNWIETVDMGGMSMKKVSFVDANTGFIVASMGYIFKTVDGGLTWTQTHRLTNINDPADNPDLNSIYFTSSSTGYICGEDGALYQTTDGGTSWTQLTVPQEVVPWILQDMVWLDDHSGIICVQNGYIIGTGITGISFPTPVAQGFQLDQNYPNPFNPETTINFKIPQSSKVKLEIFNALGQMVRKIYDGELTPGEHRLRWNGINEIGFASPSGIYFYRLSAENYSATQKMILVR